ncbi:MAG TPA: ABC transporter substrate-binding protein [Acidimicrobiia bacterium]|nr:ABC transporter substrate-binding protein [Acidimicrobiia bacterium]
MIRFWWKASVLVGLIALVGGTVPAVAQTGGTPGVTGTTINVGGIAGVTNPVGQPYASGFDGVQAYFNYINAKGGVYGRKFKLIARLDDQSRASQNTIEARSLVEEKHVFAVLPVVTQIFSGAAYLAQKGVPTFGWNINAEWDMGPNLFGEKGSYLCFTCVAAAPAVIANQLGLHTVGILAYTAPQSLSCAQGEAAGFQKYGFNVAVMDATLQFGFSDLGSDIDKLKSKGVQLIATCMDISGEVNVARSLRRAGMTNVKFYAPQGYDSGTLAKYGNELNGVYFGIEFVPFEDAKDSNAMQLFIKQMNAIHKPINEQALAGWINADLLYKGIKKAGPNFTQSSVVNAINTFNGYTADGIRLPVNWGFPDGHGPANNQANTVDVGTEACAAFVLAVNGKFVPQFGRPHQPFVCSRKNPFPPTLDASDRYYRPPLPGETLPPTATVPSTAPAQP